MTKKQIASLVLSACFLAITATGFAHAFSTHYEIVRVQE
jgi:hypothetical protein